MSQQPHSIALRSEVGLGNENSKPLVDYPKHLVCYVTQEYIGTGGREARICRSAVCG